MLRMVLLHASRVVRPASASRRRNSPRCVPLSSAARAILASAPQSIRGVLTGGDDYEILFTAPCAVVEEVLEYLTGIEVPTEQTIRGYRVRLLLTAEG